MRVYVKLMAALRGKLPPDAQGGRAQVVLEANGSVGAALETLGIGSAAVHLVMVNGEMEMNRDRTLVDGDELVVFPPVAGGGRPGYCNAASSSSVIAVTKAQPTTQLPPPSLRA